jgi:hypothetical protein
MGGFRRDNMLMGERERERLFIDGYGWVEIMKT